MGNPTSYEYPKQAGLHGGDLFDPPNNGGAMGVNGAGEALRTGPVDGWIGGGAAQPKPESDGYNQGVNNDQLDWPKTNVIPGSSFGTSYCFSQWHQTAAQVVYDNAGDYSPAGKPTYDTALAPHLEQQCNNQKNKNSCNSWRLPSNPPWSDWCNTCGDLTLVSKYKACTWDDGVLSKKPAKCKGPISTWLQFYLTTPGWNANGQGVKHRNLMQIFPINDISLKQPLQFWPDGVSKGIAPGGCFCFDGTYKSKDKPKGGGAENMVTPGKMMLPMPAHYTGHHVLITKWSEQWGANEGGPYTSFWSASDLNFTGVPTPTPAPATCSWCKPVGVASAALLHSGLQQHK